MIETALKNEVAIMKRQRLPGRGAMGYDYDSGYRIYDSYAKGGKEFAKFVIKKTGSSPKTMEWIKFII